MELIPATTNEVLDVPFTTTKDNFWIYGEGFSSTNNEKAYIKFTPNATAQVLTNKEGEVFVSQYPNLVLVEAPAGTYRMCKTRTQTAAACGVLGGGL